MNGDFLVGTWLVQPKLNTVSMNGNTVRLEPKVMEVLVCLASRAGEPVSKQEILNTVWADAFVTEDVLARSIFELRRAFKDNPRQPKFVETIPKRGYRLVASLEPTTGKVPDATVVVQRPVNGRLFSASAATATLLVFCVVIFRGNLATDSSVRVAKASSFAVQSDANVRDVPTDVGKDRSPDLAPIAVKKATLKVSHADPLLKKPAVTVVNILNNTNISQSGDVGVQGAAEKVPFRSEALFQNIAPDVVRTRVKRAILPIYPAPALQAHVTGTVEIGMAVSPRGDVYNARILIGHPMLVAPALEAMRQWSFEPNQVQGVLTWSRIRALVRFLPDGTTAVAFGPPILADSFGDPGSQRDELRDAAIAPIVPDPH